MPIAPNGVGFDYVSTLDPSTGLSVGSQSASLTQAQILAALNASMTIDCTGYASATISVSGNLNGSLRVRGSGDPVASVLGGRLLFKSGVGCLGTNIMANDGSSISREYRVVCGGRFLVIDLPTYTSGTANLVVTLTQDPTILFVNGPVHDAIEEATRASRCFNASTSMQPVTTGNFLNARFSNPAGSGKNCFIFLRRFDNNFTAVSEYYGVTNPVALTSPTTVNPSNFDTGALPSVVNFTWNMTGSRLDSSPTTAAPVGGVIPVGGSFNLENGRLVRPGQVFGHYIGGSGGGLGAAARLGITIAWFEEDVN